MSVLDRDRAARAAADSPLWAAALLPGDPPGARVRRAAAPTATCWAWR